MANRSKRTPKTRDTILAALREGKSIAAACRAARIGRTMCKEWRDEDPEFLAMFEDALEDGTDALEDEAYRRAVEQSDTLIIFLLKARRPDKYREKQTFEHTGPNGLPLTVVIAERSDGPA